METEYLLKVSRTARHLRLTIHRDGTVVVTLPRGMAQKKAHDFVLKKSRWIESALSRLKNIKNKITPQGSRSDFLLYKEQARVFAHERILHFNALYNFRYNKITIRNQKSRWGSCSRKKNLNFNYKIAVLPQPLADYIIVHELCHLGEFNHSRKFWELVGRAIPNFRELRRILVS